MSVQYGSLDQLLNKECWRFSKAAPDLHLCFESVTMEQQFATEQKAPAAIGPLVRYTFRGSATRVKDEVQGTNVCFKGSLLLNSLF